MSWIITGTQKLDPDAASYIDRVETADGQSLEQGVKLAYSTFVSGCKTDGIWDAIKASCILAGARTLDGALVPLVGTAPTNYNFVAGDYSRKSGVEGNGASKYIDTNRNSLSSDQQNNHHAAIFPTLLPDEDPGAGGNDFGAVLASRILNSSAGSIQILNVGSSNPNPNVISYISAFTGDVGYQSKSINRLCGLSRNNSTNFTSRTNGVDLVTSATSQTLANANYLLLARSVGGSGENYSNARLSFYSIGESLDLALLDARVTTLMSDLAAAIP